MLIGLDLFSGIGGLGIALKEWVLPICYCEIDRYCQGVLLNNMHYRELHQAPIWDDIKTFDGRTFCGMVDIIYAGFPCQGISIAGLGKGLEDERSGLVYEIFRLAKDIRPTFIFLENVPQITSRGGVALVQELTKMRYDCRWCTLSAASLGAPHKRERWFLLAYAKYHGLSPSQIGRSAEEGIPNSPEGKDSTEQSKGMDSARDVAESSITNSNDKKQRLGSRSKERQSKSGMDNKKSYWQETECPVCGVDDVVPYRVDRIRGLGNAVVPIQAKEAFEILMGLK